MWSGTAASFEEARAEFEAAWRMFLSNRTEADFQEWRDQRDWTDRNTPFGRPANISGRRATASESRAAGT